MKFPKMHKPSFMAFCLAMALEAAMKSIQSCLIRGAVSVPR